MQKNGRFRFNKANENKVVTVDEEKEDRKRIKAIIDKVLPSLENIDRLIRSVEVGLTKDRVLFSFKIKRRFFQTVIDRKMMTDEDAIKKLFTNILKRELLNFEYTR